MSSTRPGNVHRQRSFMLLLVTVLLLTGFQALPAASQVIDGPIVPLPTTEPPGADDGPVLIGTLPPNLLLPLVTPEPTVDPRRTGRQTPTPTEAPLVPTEAPTVVADQAMPHDLTIAKYACPAGYDDTGASLTTLRQECSGHAGAVDFTLADASGPLQTSSIVDGGVPIVWFDDVPAGVVEVQEAVPPGYEVMAIWCTDDAPDPTIDSFTPQGINKGSTLLWFFEDGKPANCLWFNREVESTPTGDNTVVVHKWECPGGLDPVDGKPLDSWLQTCTTPQDGVEFTLANPGGVHPQTTANGVIEWSGQPLGDFTIAETIPPDFGEPVVYCAIAIPTSGGPMVQVPSPGGVVAASFQVPGSTYTCHVFNIVTGGDPSFGNRVILHKWECPEKPPKGTLLSWYSQECASPFDGVQFSLETANGSMSATTTGGTAGFINVPNGQIAIQESIPAGFGDPVVTCTVSGMPVDTDVFNGRIQHTFPGVGETLECQWYNVPGEPPSVTVVKWTCPEGYDPYAAGADAEADCTQATDGVDFSFRYDDAVVAVGTTGDAGPGQVTVENLLPGTLTVTELVPDGIQQVLVTACYGHIMGQLQPYPLSQTETATISLDAGEHLTCHWFNIPEPDGGTVVLTKYTCTTPTFISDIDCQIEEGGVTFDLLDQNGAVVSTATTDGVGRITWSGLANGDYWLAEHGSNWCRIQATPSAGGDTFGVNAGEETVVNVWNCGAEPGQPGDMPTKYPNTGLPAKHVLESPQLAAEVAKQPDVAGEDAPSPLVNLAQNRPFIVIEDPTVMDRLYLKVRQIPGWLGLAIATGVGWWSWRRRNREDDWHGDTNADPPPRWLSSRNPNDRT